MTIVTTPKNTTSVPKYQIKETKDGLAFQCFGCNYLSHNPDDIKYKYCYVCKKFYLDK